MANERGRDARGSRCARIRRSRRSTSPSKASVGIGHGDATSGGYSLAKRFRPRIAACRAVGVDDLGVVLGRVAMPDARFYPSIGLEEWDEFL